MAGIWTEISRVTTPSWTSVSSITTPSWSNISEITSPSWTSVSSISTPSWSTVTISNSISYDENYGPTPSLEKVNAWNLITDNWEHFSYEYEDLII